jgi:hypothetical protein
MLASQCEVNAFPNFQIFNPETQFRRAQQGVIQSLQGAVRANECIEILPMSNAQFTLHATPQFSGS